MKNIFNYILPAGGEKIDETFQKKLECAIEKLPKENREAIVLFFSEKVPRKEIASIMGWSTSKVNSKITRGISLLKWQLNPGSFEKAKKIFERKINEGVLPLFEKREN